MAFRDQTYLNFPDKSMTGFLTKQMESNHPEPNADLGNFEKGQIIGKAGDLLEASIELTNDPEFESLIAENTSGKARVWRDDSFCGKR